MSNKKGRGPASAEVEFTDEFKAEAVRLVEESGGNIAKVAKELNIYDSSLGNRRSARPGKRPRARPGLNTERAEIRELKRELERVKRDAGHPGKSRGHDLLLERTTRGTPVTAVFLRSLLRSRPTIDCPWSVAEMCRVLEVSRSGYYLFLAGSAAV